MFLRFTLRQGTTLTALPPKVSTVWPRVLSDPEVTAVATAEATVEPDSAQRLVPFQTQSAQEPFQTAGRRDNLIQVTLLMSKVYGIHF